MLILFSIIEVLLFVFFVLGILIFIVFIVNFFKSKQMNKAIFKDVFKGKLSVFILLAFYFISFGLIGGLNTYNSKEIHASNEFTVTKSHIGQGYTSPGDITLVDRSDYLNNPNYPPGFEVSEDAKWNSLYTDFFSEEYTNNVIIPSGFSEDDLYSSFYFKGFSLTYYYWFTHSKTLPASTIEDSANDIFLWWSESPYASDFYGNIENLISIYLFWNHSINPNGSNHQDVQDQYGNIDYDVELQYVYSPLDNNSENEPGKSSSYFFMGYNSLIENLAPEEDDVFSANSRSYDGAYVLNQPIVNKNFTNLSNDDLLNDLFGSAYDETDPIYGDGTLENPYKTLMLDNYYQANKSFFDQNNNVFLIGPYYFEIVGTAWFPNASYPVHNLNNLLTDVNNEQTMVINNYALSNIANGNQTFVFYFGFEDLYDKINDYTDILYGPTSKKIEEESNALIEQTEKRYYEYLFAGEINNDSNDFVSARSVSLLAQAESDKATIVIFQFLFLIIVLIVLFLLIQKRINDSAKNLGTLKALGMSKWNIASSYIIYPIVITAMGAFIAFLISIPIQFYFFNFLTNYFAIPGSSYVLTFSTFYLIFIFPLLVSCGISFLISYYVLRKPTLELLQNSGINKPGFLTITLGKLVPKGLSFSTVYKIKSIFRSTGKSFVLFFTMIFSTFLIALSFSSSTMVNKVISQSTNELNYQSFVVLNQNYRYLTYSYDDSDYWATDSVPTDNLSYNYSYSPIIWDFSDDLNYQDMGKEILYNDDSILNPVNPYQIYNYDSGTDTYQFSYLDKTSLLNYFSFIYNNPAIIAQSNTDFTGTNVSNSDLLKLDFYFWTYSYNNFKYYKTQNSSNLTDVAKSIATLQEFTNETLIEYNPSVGLSSLTGTGDSLYSDDSYNKIYVDINFENYFYNSDFQTLIYNDNLILDDSDSDDDITISIKSFNDINEINNLFINIDDLTEAINNFENYVPSQADNGNYYIPLITTEYYYNIIQNNATFTGYDDGYETYNGKFKYKDINNNETTKDISFTIIGTYSSYTSTSNYTTREAIANGVGDNISLKPLEIYADDFYQQLYSFSLSNVLISKILEDPATPLFITQVLDNNYQTLEYFSIDNDLVFDQIDSAYSIISKILILISLFAFFIAFVLISITIKLVADNSIREVSMFKVFGYTNWKATSLVMTSYIIILIISFLISLSLIFTFLLALSIGLTNLTGTTFSFTLTAGQFSILVFLILFLIIILLIFVYITFSKANPLDSLKQTEE